MTDRSPSSASVEFNRDSFLRDVIRHLSGTLEEVVGIEDARGFLSLVAQRIGDDFNAAYREALETDTLDLQQVADVLVDLKRRIDGDFYIIEVTDEQIVLGNRRCPFGDRVLDRPSLCMMTSNMFGAISAENLGYAKVTLEQTIARRAPECRIVIHLKPSPQTKTVEGREYFQG